MTKTVHPFPARMAPGLALDSLKSLKRGSIVLDPMAGSGTVLREATELGLKAVGFDVDPLAVLMTKVWTTRVSDKRIEELYGKFVSLARSLHREGPPEYMDAETINFVNYWFCKRQRDVLTRYARALQRLDERETAPATRAALDVLKLNLSRIIVTKERVASLARDTSHSRPHKVVSQSWYDVADGYERSLRVLRARLKEEPPSPGSKNYLGDARSMGRIRDNSIDAIVTSPPYLNAIDYLRGHRMALVWLGWNLADLRSIRSSSIGAERGLSDADVEEGVETIVTAMVRSSQLSTRYRGMVRRYARDLWDVCAEVSRVLKPKGKATFVVGNSRLKGVFIKNADGVAAAAEIFGLAEKKRTERELPTNSRYLPVTGTALAKRMRTETVIAFAA